jgi:hypothetical protein
MKRAATLYSIVLAATVALLIFPARAHAQFPRTTLIEEFTSATCKPCTTATPIINTIVRTKAPHAVSIRYHLNFPAPGDPWYAANTAHNLARRDYYGATSLPYGRLDGATTLSVTQQGEVQDKVDERLGIEAPVKMEVTQTRDGDQFNVKVVVTAGDAGLDGNYKLQVVAVESHVHSDAFQQEPFNKESDFYDIMRTMIPGADGTDISLAANQKKSFTFSYALGNGWQGDEMHTVAFVQNDVSKQIVQAGFSSAASGAVPEAPSTSAADYLDASYPNPTSNATTIAYALAAPQHVTIDLYTLAGERVMSFDEGMKSSGSHELPVDLSGIPAGVYTYTISAGKFHAARMMTVVR